MSNAATSTSNWVTGQAPALGAKSTDTLDAEITSRLVEGGDWQRTQGICC
jgi:hypothetical protein